MIKVKSEFLIIPTDTQPSQKIYFKDNPVITNSILIGLQIPVAFLELGRYQPPFNIRVPFYENVEIGDFTGSISGYNSFFLTLVNHKGEEVHKNLNLFTFYVGINKGKIFNHFYNDIDLKKSYIQCSGDPYNSNPPIEPIGILFDFIIDTKD